MFSWIFGLILSYILLILISVLMVSFSQAFSIFSSKYNSFFYNLFYCFPWVWKHLESFKTLETVWKYVLQNLENFHYFSAMSNILNLQLCQYWDNSDLTSMAVVNVMKNINVAKLEVLVRSASTFLSFVRFHIWKDVWFHWGAL